LRLQEADATVELGLTRENLLREPSPPQLVQQLLITRMEQELGAGSARASQGDVENDWKLLQKSFALESGKPYRSFSATGYRH
jgi:dihydrofolate reductase